mgnify:CR=1 FL=1
MSNQLPPFYCYNHPNRETSLRCNRCERPICSECAILTPTGYRCKECVRSQQKIFETAKWIDYPLAFVIAAALSFAGSLLASLLGFFTIFIAPVAGVVIAEAVRLATGRRRSKRLYQVTTAGAIIGALPQLLLPLLALLFRGSLGGALFPILWQGIYLFVMVPAMYYRLSGIQIR